MQIRLHVNGHSWLKKIAPRDPTRIVNLKLLPCFFCRLLTFAGRMNDVGIDEPNMMDTVNLYRYEFLSPGREDLIGQALVTVVSA